MKKMILFLTILLFTTSLAFGAVLTEGFEDAWPPTDWTNSSWDLSSYGDPHSGSEFAYSNTTGSILTTLQVNASSIQNLTFWYRCESSSYPQDLDVMVGTDVIHQITGLASTTYAQADVSLAAYDGQTIRIKFIGQSGTGGWDYGICVDDVAGPELYVPAYPMPTDLTTGSITQTTASLDWTNGGAESSWDVEYGASGYTQGAGTTISGISSHPYTLNPPLTAGTGYDWYVRSNYGGGNYSAWAGSESFTTVFAPVTSFPWTEDFEDDWIGSPAAPPSWSQITVSGTNVWDISTTSPHGGTYCAKAPWASAGGEHLLITPELVFGTTDYRLKFWLKGSSSTGTDLKVQIANDNSAAGNFTTDLAYYVAGINMPTTWTEYTIDLSAYENSQYIAFRMIDDDGYSLYIDDVTVEEIPTTPIFSVSPTSKDFGTVNISSSSTAQTFTISNTGGGTLIIANGGISLTGTDAGQFDLTDGNSYPINLTAGQSATVDVTFAPTTAGAKTATLQIVDNITDATNTVALSGTGFEANYGGGGAAQGNYYFANSLATGAPSAPTYDWIDISTTGTDVSGTVSGDNSVGGPYDIGFTFNYFGVDYTQFWICADGYIDLVIEASSDYTNNPIPSSGEPNNIIALLWDDMDPGDTSVTGYHLYYGTSGGNMVITYEKMPEYGADENGWFTAQAILYPSGNINLQYKEVGSSFDLTSCTVGIENAAGDAGVQYLYNTTGGPIYNGSPIAVMFGTDDSALPYVLSDFSTAVYANEFVQISWATQSEVNMNCWNLYRQDPGSDEQIDIYSVQATNTTEPYEYIYNDIYLEIGETYYYYLESIEYDGTSQMYGPVSATMEGEEIPEFPGQTELFGNYPNPFNPDTFINFNVKADEQATLTIFNTRGQSVMKKTFEPGFYNYNWLADSYPSGVYFYKLQTESHTSTKKMLLLK